jgi:cell filamentation protein
VATLNAIHAFRGGNGRTQTTFLALLADRAGHPLDLARLKPRALLNAMIASFRGDERLLVRQLLRLTERKSGA